MSDTSAFGFGKFVPGFDFLQNLSKSAAQPASAAGPIPGMASWVAPTLSIEEIDKRIQELKAVQFWLDQNATALKATIQAMEVQKMTLSTLQSMNVNMSDLAKAFTAKPPATEAAPAAASAATASSLFSPKPTPAPEPQAATAPPQAEPPAATVAGDAQEGAAKPAVDPMHWWGALTQQFQGIAAAAMKDVAAEAMKAGMAAKSAAETVAETAAETAKTVMKPKAAPAKKASAKSAAKAAAKPAAKAAVKSAAKPAARKAPAKKRPAA